MRFWRDRGECLTKCWTHFTGRKPMSDDDRHGAKVVSRDKEMYLVCGCSLDMAVFEELLVVYGMLPYQDSASDTTTLKVLGAARPFSMDFFKFLTGLEFFFETFVTLKATQAVLVNFPLALLP
ncbi:hypothetical protein R6Q59_009922 [Mikania micrantha]